MKEFGAGLMAHRGHTRIGVRGILRTESIRGFISRMGGLLIPLLKGKLVFVNINMHQMMSKKGQMGSDDQGTNITILCINKICCTIRLHKINLPYYLSN